MVKKKRSHEAVVTVRGVSVTTSLQAADSAECRAACQEEGECRYWVVLEVLGGIGGTWWYWRYWEILEVLGGIGGTGWYRRYWEVSAVLGGI